MSGGHIAINATSRKDGRIIEPNSERWRQIRIGMTIQEVQALLGPPLRGANDKSARCARAPSDGGNGVIIWNYGELRFDSPAMPSSFEFHLGAAEK